jgi:hypothetical protein
LFTACMILPVAAHSRPIKIAAWNIEQLSDKNNEGPNELEISRRPHKRLLFSCISAC